MVCIFFGHREDCSLRFVLSFYVHRRNALLIRRLRRHLLHGTSHKGVSAGEGFLVRLLRL